MEIVTVYIRNISTEIISGLVARIQLKERKKSNARNYGDETCNSVMVGKWIINAIHGNLTCVSIKRYHADGTGTVSVANESKLKKFPSAKKGALHTWPSVCQCPTRTEIDRKV